MIFVLPKPQTFIQLHLLVIIAMSFIHKYSKYGKNILEMAEFIRYLSCTSLIFFNALQSQIHSCFIVHRIQIPIILQQHICCTTYSRNFCIRYNNNKLFLALLKSTLAIIMVSCIAITLVWHILYFKICNLYSFLLICL